MNERVVLVAISIRYLVIVVALLRTSLGATPTLRVFYRLNNVDNQNAVECYNGDMLLSGATFTFMAPDDAETEQTGPPRLETLVADGTSYVFTVSPNNETVVTCSGTLDSETSDPVRVAAIPQYTADVNTIRQYIYSDSEVADIECPFQLGLLRNLYEFSWNTVASDGFPESIPDGTQGMYWLEEEKNRTLHVNILAAGNQRDFQCVGRVQICTGSTSDSCMVTQDSTSSSPVITIINNITRPSITEPPADVTVNQGEPATFTCTAAGSGELTIGWSCSDGSNCGQFSQLDREDGNVTSTLVIIGASTNLNVTCVVNQSLASFLSGASGIEPRLPPPIEAVRKIAQLTVTPTPTTTQPPATSEASTNVANHLTIIILAIVLVFILAIIVILGACIVCIFRYHYRNEESCLGQRLRKTFSHCSMKRDPLYAIPTDISKEGNHDTQQVPQREVAIVVAHPIYNQTSMLMQENTAYGTDIAIAPEIPTEQNVAYVHMSCGEKAASVSNSGTISHQLMHTNDVEMGHFINQDELSSTTDVTSTTTDSAIFPCPISMNLPGTRVETLV